jgi:ABC-2 type transport system ATP-binding protein
MPSALPAVTDASSPAALACSDLSSGYRGKRVLEGISFEIRDPAIYVVLGPNGAGKTTLFRTIAGILRLQSGSVTIGGHSIEEPSTRDRIHFLSHIDGLPDGLRVEETLRLYGTVEGAEEADVERVLRLLEIEPLRARFVSELSAGQKKRVAIARVFLHDRAVYLLDEPTANLDPKVASEIRDLILRLSRDRVVLYSSHNLFEAREIGTYVLALKSGKLSLFGRIADLKPNKYVVGVRVVAGEQYLPAANKKGEYYLFELSGPDDVTGLIKELEGKGVRFREVKEMGNPLEDMFAE